jgi:hypothetical protein
METIIKNIHLIDSLDDLQVKKLVAGALQHQKFSRITFKILSIETNVIKIQTVQGKTPQENYADEKTLIERTGELFGKFFPNHRVVVNAVTYKENPTEQVTPEYIRHAMTEHHVKVKDIVADTGIDKTNVSAWINGTREMSQPVRALFYYYLLVKSRLEVNKLG